MKIGIVGTGSVGNASAMAAAVRGSAREIVLVNRTRKTAEAVATDIRYGVPVASKVDLIDGDYADLAGAQVVLVTSGVNEKTGGATDRNDPQGRLRLLGKNAEIYRDIVPKIVDAAPAGRAARVTDPPDPLADIARETRPGATVLSAGTYLDSQRFRVHLGKYFDVDPAHVEAQVIGDHGTAQVFLWSSARIGGVPITTLLKTRGENLKISERGWRKRFATPTSPSSKVTMPVSMASESYQSGSPRWCLRMSAPSFRSEAFTRSFGVTLSLPSVVGRGGVIDVLEPELSDEEQAGLVKSAKILKAALERVRDQ